MADVLPPPNGQAYDAPADGANRTGDLPVPPAGDGPADAILKETDTIIYSDIGITTLLDRLKQSIASAKDFSTFLKKRSAIEDEHAKSLVRLARATQEALHHAEVKQGSYARQMEETMRMHEKLASNGTQFSLSLHQMHEDLLELTNNMERGRKQWKHEGLSAEKKATDAEALMTRAKAKYDGLAEDYDRAKTGDVKGSRKFIKGPKSAAQYEEDILRKLQLSDTDYQEKVSSARAQRDELIRTTRPRAVRAIQELITECDSAVTLQLQKFATFNEKLFLANGILITPLPSDGSGQKSLRDIVAVVDNTYDFNHYLLGHKSKVPPRKPNIEYKKHPTLAPRNAPGTDNRQVSSSFPTAPAAAPFQPQPPPSSFSVQPQQPSPQIPESSFGQPPNGHGRTFSFEGEQGTAAPTYAQNVAPSSVPQDFGPSRTAQSSFQPPTSQYSGPPYPTGAAASQANAPAQIPYHEGPPQTTGPPATTGPPHSTVPPTSMVGAAPVPSTVGGGVPTRPVFGVSLEELFARDGSAVPMVVYQCMQAVDLFGLSVEGIYRQNGTAVHIQQLKALFDKDAARVDFRNPASFHHDVNSVAGLLKQFFRDLPDPLFTKDRYAEFISAARIDDDIVRRDTLHAIINGLPDANYATLRALVLHLHRVQEHQGQNRMSSSNLSICFAPSLMGVSGNTQIQDSALQARVIDTILISTYQIFDED